MLLPRLATFGCFTAMFLFCQMKKDNSHIDSWWGISFIIPNLVMMLMKYNAGHKLDRRTIALNVLVTLWGVRLCWHIAKRHKGEDYRYVNMRNRWKEYSTPKFYFTVFMYIFMMQFAFSCLVNASATFVTANSAGQALCWTDFVGLGVGGAGLLMEAVADKQLTAHIANPDTKKGKFI